jgi:hypothetical protein
MAIPGTHSIPKKFEREMILQKMRRSNTRQKQEISKPV